MFDEKMLYLDHTVVCVMYVSDTVQVVYGSKECYKRRVLEYVTDDVA